MQALKGRLNPTSKEVGFNSLAGALVRPAEMISVRVYVALYFSCLE
jgi:hypothetical protein